MTAHAAAFIADFAVDTALDARPDLAATLARLDRPRLLVAAARHAVPGLRQRMTQPAESRRPRIKPVQALLAEEARLEEDRALGAPGYQPRRHIAVLAALLVLAG